MWHTPVAGSQGIDVVLDDGFRPFQRLTVLLSLFLSYRRAAYLKKHSNAMKNAYRKPGPPDKKLPRSTYSLKNIGKADAKPRKTPPVLPFSARFAAPSIEYWVNFRKLS